MLNISKPLSSGQAQTYHKLEFTSERANYYKQDGAVEGQWQGQLATKMGLTGTVTAEEFARLTEGRHPQTDEPMVTHTWQAAASQRRLQHPTRSAHAIPTARCCE